MILTWKNKSEILQPTDKKIFMFLVKSYGKIDLLLNAGSKILINLWYWPGNADTWLPQQPPLGWPCSLLGAGNCTPACEIPSMQNVTPGSSHLANPCGTGQKVSPVRIKELGSGMTETSVPVCGAKQIMPLGKKDQRHDSKVPIWQKTIHCHAFFKTIFQSISLMCREHLELFKQ